MPEQLLNSQEDEEKTNTYSKQFGLPERMRLFFFHPPGYSVADQARKLEPEKQKILTQKVLALTEENTLRFFKCNYFILL